MAKNLWILSEERPKKEIIKQIIHKFCLDKNIVCFIDTIRVLPILNEKHNFSFVYEVVGIRTNQINKIFIKSVSGSSSFVDYLVFLQNDEPNQNDEPIYAIEETKTDDSESRNTGIFQRATKFVYIDFFYPNIKKIMLYNLKINEKSKPTMTNIFGTRCLKTIDIEIIGKSKNKELKPFESIKELIDYKNSMRKAPKGNVPIEIKIINESKIEVSGRLYKSNSLAHDPNIGALSLICFTIRKLGWKGRICITKHGLNQNHIKSKNKFIQISNKLNIELENLKLPKEELNKTYWHYEKEGEKLGTIFIHLIIENFTKGNFIFENHAGCEKGYFLKKDGTPIVLNKYTDKVKYKNGDKKQIVNIPDLILIDFEENEIINIEGKKYHLLYKAKEEIKNFSAIENLYIKPEYPEFKIIRTIVLYGSEKESILEIQVGFLLNKNGKLILGIEAPTLFKEAVNNLIDFWNKN